MNNLPLDCLGQILKYIEDSYTYLSLMLICKRYYQYIKKGEYENNIVYNSSCRPLMETYSKDIELSFKDIKKKLHVGIKKFAIAPGYDFEVYIPNVIKDSANEVHINFHGVKLFGGSKCIVITFDKYGKIIKNKTSKFVSIGIKKYSSKNQEKDLVIIITKKGETITNKITNHNSFEIYFDTKKNSSKKYMFNGEFKVKLYIYSRCKIFNHQKNLLNYYLKNDKFKEFNTLSLLEEIPQYIHTKNFPDRYIYYNDNKIHYKLPITDYILTEKILNPKYLDIIELYRKYGVRGGHNEIMFNILDHKYLFKNNKCLYWIPKKYKYYIIRTKNKNFKINLDIANNIKKILPSKICEIIKKFKTTSKQIDAFICGSSILKLVTNLEFESDVDIMIGYRYRKGNALHLFIGHLISELFLNDMKFKVIKRLKHRVILKLIGKKDITLDIFSKIGESYEIIRNFHLPCVRAMYSLKEKKLYCYNSFIRSLSLKLNYNLRRRCHYDEKVILKIYTKYFNRGFEYLFNEYDKNKFIKHLKKNKIKYTLEEYNK